MFQSMTSFTRTYEPQNVQKTQAWWRGGDHWKATVRTRCVSFPWVSVMPEHARFSTLAAQGHFCSAVLFWFPRRVGLIRAYNQPILGNLHSRPRRSSKAIWCFSGIYCQKRNDISICSNKARHVWLQKVDKFENGHFCSAKGFVIRAKICRFLENLFVNLSWVLKAITDKSTIFEATFAYFFFFPFLPFLPGFFPFAPFPVGSSSSPWAAFRRFLPKGVLPYQLWKSQK